MSATERGERRRIVDKLGTASGGRDETDGVTEVNESG